MGNLVLRVLFVAVVLASGVAAQKTDPSYSPLDNAYQALRDKNYDQAVANFEQAIASDPARASSHKDLAYALLKIGENEEAREQFAEAMRLDPGDDQAALEYAFLCYETKQPIAARRVFDRIRKTGNATAERAFQNIDRPLGEGISRWLSVLAIEPENFSAQEELANLAEQRDDLALAAEHYERAWQLKRDRRDLMLDLGRVRQEQGRTEEALSLLLAASRGAEPRVAERARELLPDRYPYVYEFEAALELDPQNFELRRELAYLELQMGNRDPAEKQFEKLNGMAPEDVLTAAQLGFLRLNRGDFAGSAPLLDQVLRSGDEELADRVRSALKLSQTLRKRNSTAQRTSEEAKEFGEKSLQAGYLKDALKYLTIAHENDPLDFDVMLKLGWAYNILKDDSEAVKWFHLATKSPDPQVSKEAAQASRNLEPDLEPLRISGWVYPFFSTRWHDAFGYGQFKTELRLGKFPLHPYLSARLVGDTRQTTGSTAFASSPQYLSEDSF